VEPASIAFVGLRVRVPGAQRSRAESTSRLQGLRRVCATCGLASLGWAVPAGAQDYTRNEEPAPRSVEELSGPIVLAFPDEAPKRTPVLPGAKKTLSRFPPFVSDMLLGVNLRSYYFLRDLSEDRTLPVPEKGEAWAIGGSIAAETGWLWNTIALGGELFTSVSRQQKSDILRS
jgi:hypothetical protein